MTSKETSTPLKASDIRFPRPRKSFVLPRTLATDDLYTTDRAVREEDLEEHYKEEEQIEDLSSTDLVTSLLAASAKSTY